MWGQGHAVNREEARDKTHKARLGWRSRPPPSHRPTTPPPPRPPQDPGAPAFGAKDISFQLCFDKHQDSCRRHAGINRSSPGQPAPCRATRPFIPLGCSRAAGPAPSTRPPVHPVRAGDARGHTGAPAPAALLRVPENKGSFGDFTSLTWRHLLLGAAG